MATTPNSGARRGITLGGLVLVALTLIPACGGNESSVDSTDAPRTKNAALPAAGLPEPVARYTFDGDFVDAFGYSAAAPLGACSTAAPEAPCNATSSFGTAANGDGYWTWRSTNPRGGGFAITTSQPIIAPYSVGLRFELERTAPEYRKIIDYADQRSDNGFYFLDGRIMFYPKQDQRENGPAYEPNTVIDLVATLTTDRLFTVYSPNTDGTMTKLYEYTDTNLNADPARKGTGSILGFFFDDQETKSEAARSGRIYELRLWNTALTSEQVNRAVPTTLPTGGGGVGVGATTTTFAAGGIGATTTTSTVVGVPVATTTTTSVAPTTVPMTTTTTTIIPRATTTVPRTTTTAARPPVTTVPQTTTTVPRVITTTTTTSVPRTTTTVPRTTTVPPTTTTVPRTTTTTARPPVTTVPQTTTTAPRVITTTTVRTPAGPPQATPTTAKRDIGYSCVGRERELAPTNLRVNDRTYPDYELTWTQPSAAAIKPLLDELASYGRTPPRGWSFSYETSVNGGRTWSTYDYQLSDLTSGRIKINGPADQFLVRIVNRNFGFLSPCLTEASNEVSVTKPILGVSCINNAATLSPRNVTIDRSKAPSIAVSWTAPTGAQLQPVLDELKSFGRGDPRQFTFDVQYSTNNGGSWKSLSQELSDAYLLTTSATYRPITATDFLLRVTTVNYGFLTDCKLISETIRYTRPILGASCVGRGAELAPKNLRVDRSIWPLFKLSWTNPSAAQMQPLVDELKTFSKTDPGRWSYRIEISTNGGSTWRVDWPGSTYSRDERGDSIVLDYSWNANAIARVVYTGYGFLTECKPEPSAEIDVSKPALGAACIADPGAYVPRNLTVTRVGTTNSFRLSWTQPNNSQMQPLVDELRALGRPAPARWDYQVEISTDGFNKFYAAQPATLTAALPASVNVIVSPKNFQIRVTNVKFGDLTSCGPNSSNIVEVRTN